MQSEGEARREGRWAGRTKAEGGGVELDPRLGQSCENVAILDLDLVEYSAGFSLARPASGV